MYHERAPVERRLPACRSAGF